MALSKIRQLASTAKVKSSNKMISSSAQSFLFYGTTGGKSVLSATQLTKEPVLVLSPAGGSSHLTEEYENCVFYSIDSLDELKLIVKDLEDNMNVIRKLSVLEKDDLKLYKEKVFSKQFDKSQAKEMEEEWIDLMHYATTGTFPFHSVVLEEMDIVSTWLTDEVEKLFSLNVIGEDKKNLSSDWAELRKMVVAFYSRFLKLPVRTIFATSDKLPKEVQGATAITPNICQGAAARLLIGMIGNVLYVYKDGDKFFVRLLPNASHPMIRTKLSPVKKPISLPETLDITGKPELFWELVKKCEDARTSEVKK